MLEISSQLLLIEFSRFMESKLAWAIFHTWTFCQLHSLYQPLYPHSIPHYLFIRNLKVSAFRDAMMKRHCLFVDKNGFLKNFSNFILNWVIFNPLLFYVVYFNGKKLFLCVISLSSLSFFISFRNAMTLPSMQYLPSFPFILINSIKKMHSTSELFSFLLFLW